MTEKAPICSECGNTFPATQQTSTLFPDGGMTFAPRSFGHYGGFTDNTSWDPITDDNYVMLCHDCCLRLVRSFASIAKALGNFGHHPCSEDTPCCEFSWTFKRNPNTNELQTYLGTRDGEWVLDLRKKSGPGGD